jgi:hypothetical protein
LAFHGKYEIPLKKAILDKGHWETFRAQFHSTSEIAQEISRKCSGWMRKAFEAREESNI